MDGGGAENEDDAMFDETFDDNDDFDIVGNSKAAIGLMKEAERKFKSESKAPGSKSEEIVESEVKVTDISTENAQTGMRTAISSVMNVLDDDGQEINRSQRKKAANSGKMVTPAKGQSPWGKLGLPQGGASNMFSPFSTPPRASNGSPAMYRQAGSRFPGPPPSQFNPGLPPGAVVPPPGARFPSNSPGPGVRFPRNSRGPKAPMMSQFGPGFPRPKEASGPPGAIPGPRGMFPPPSRGGMPGPMRGPVPGPMPVNRNGAPTMPPAHPWAVQSSRYRDSPSPVAGHPPSLKYMPVDRKKDKKTNSNSKPGFIQLPLPKSKRFNLMMKSEIALNIRLQLLQLATGTQEEHDYYYKVHQSRLGFPYARSAVIDGFRLKQNPDRNPDGTPKLSSTNLGKIKASSLRRPKKLMDLTGGKSIEETDVYDTSEEIKDDAKVKPRTFMFGWLSLSYLIEAGYQCLQRIEDVDERLRFLLDPRSIADPDLVTKRGILGEQQKENVKDLKEALDLIQNPKPSDDHVILQFSTLRKGRVLLYRSLMNLPPFEASRVVAIILHDSFTFSCYKLPIDGKIVGAIHRVLNGMPLEAINHIFLSIAKQSQVNGGAKFFSSNLVCMSLQVICKRAHDTTEELQSRETAGHRPSGNMIGKQELTRALQHWKQIHQFVFVMIKKNLRGGFFSSYLQKKEDSKEKKKSTNASPVPAGLEDLWELLAGLISHGTTDHKRAIQKDMLDIVNDKTLMPRDITKSRGYMYLKGVFMKRDR